MNCVHIFPLMSVLLSGPSAVAQTTCYDRSQQPHTPVCFSQGDISFADYVIRIDLDHSGQTTGPCIPTDANSLDPAAALGVPDYAHGVGTVSLGKGGLLEVGFLDNVLTNSGDSGTDVWVFEDGPVMERVFLAIRPDDAITLDRMIAAGVPDDDHDGFFELGYITGGTSGADIDGFAPGFAAGELRFDAVQVIDVPDHADNCNNNRDGADVDAIGAISAEPDLPIGDEVPCASVSNSSGRSGKLVVTGSAVVQEDDLTLTALDLPTEPNVGYFLMGTGSNDFTPPGSAGPMCVAPGFYRILPPQSATDDFVGGFTREVGTSGQQTSRILPGSTWSFQAWHRDSAAGLSNFTDAVRVTFH